MDQQRIGQFIHEQRKTHGMTQQELADQLGVTNKAVSKWEKGHSMPDVALFEPLCKELEISIPELLSGRRIDAEDQQQTAEQLLMESISMRKLIGLSVFLQLNSIIGVLLVISPFLFHPERPLNLSLRLHDLPVSDHRGDQLSRVRARGRPAHHGDPGFPDSLRPCAFDSVFHLAIPERQISENAKKSLLPGEGNRLDVFQP